MMNEIQKVNSYQLWNPRHFRRFRERTKGKMKKEDMKEKVYSGGFWRQNIAYQMGH